MISLLVIRHAPTDWNERRMIQGRTDRPLSPAGRLLAAQWRLPPGWAGAACLASPLQRAVETARLLGLDPQPDARLVEMAWGDYEGRSLPELRAASGAPFEAEERRGLDFRPAGGESPRDVQARLLPLLRELSGPTVVVTHKGVLRALLASATGWDMREKAPAKLLPARAHEFGIDRDGRAVVVQLNFPLEHTP